MANYSALLEFFKKVQAERYRHLFNIGDRVRLRALEDRKWCADNNESYTGTIIGYSRSPSAEANFYSVLWDDYMSYDYACDWDKEEECLDYLHDYAMHEKELEAIPSQELADAARPK